MSRQGEFSPVFETTRGHPVRALGVDHLFCSVALPRFWPLLLKQEFWPEVVVREGRMTHAETASVRPDIILRGIFIITFSPGGGVAVG